MKMTKIFLALWLLLCTVGGAFAQNAPPSPQPAPVVCGNATLSVTNASGSVALPSITISCNVITLINDGSAEVFVNFGGIAVTAATTNVPIQAGGNFSVWTNQLYVAAITSTGSSTLRVIQANGPVNYSASGSSSSGGGGLPAATTPAAATASAIVTGGVAVTLVTGPVNGCYVTNPLSATDQNIVTAEVVQVNPVTAASAAGRGTNSTLQPGQTFTCPPGMTTNLSAIAATTAHAFNVVKW